MSFRVCIIGCGRHSSQVHGPSLCHYAASSSAVELAGACDLDATRAEAFAREFKFARAYSNAHQMVEAEHPDAVVVVLPPELLGPACRDLLLAGVPLLVEKPPALTTENLEKLIGWAKAGNCAVQVAFNRRYSPLFVAARRILDEQIPLSGVFRVDYEMVRWRRRDPDFSTTAIHALDAAMFLARSPFSRVDLEYQERPDIGPGVVNIEARGECRGGAQVRLSFQPVAGVVVERASVHAPDHSLMLNVPLWNAGGGLEHWKNGKLATRHDCSRTAQGDHLCQWGGFAAQIRAFLDGVRAGAQLTPTLEDARQPVRLMEAIRRRLTEIRFEETRRGGADARDVASLNINPP